MNANKKPQVFKIYGMDCAEEVTTLKRELRPLVGGEERLAFDILNGKLFVEASAAISPEEVIQAITRTGMRAEVWQEDVDQQSDTSFWQQHGRNVLTVASGVFGLLGFLYHAKRAGSISGALGSEGMGVAESVPPLAILLYLAGVSTGVWQVFPKAWRAAIGLRPDINLLMTVAVVGAAAIGEWFEAATVAFLFSVSLVLESWSVGRARRAIRSEEHTSELQSH